MDTRLKEHIHPKKFIALLAVLTALFGIATFGVADVFILPLAAFFALLLLFDDKKKLFGMGAALVLIAVSFFGGIGAIYSVCAGLCCGLILYLMYRAHCSKTDTVFAITAFFVFYLFLALFLAIGGILGDYSISAAISFCEEFIDQLRIDFIDQISAIHVTDEAGNNHFLFNAETAEQIFLAAVRLLVSFFIITAFFFCGIVCKIFSKVAAYAEKDEAFILSWRFLPPSVFAYFYLAVFALSIFGGTGETAFAFALNNLLYVFMAVFAYLGFCHLLKMLKNASGRRPGIWITVILLFVILSVSAAQILSFFGVYATIVANKIASEK